MARRNSLARKAKRRQERSGRRLNPTQSVDLSKTTELLHEHLTESLCQTVYQRNRVSEREREWSLHALADFWTAVILRAPKALTHALEEGSRGLPGWTPVQTTDEAFFKRCKTLSWKFFAGLFHEFSARILKVAPPGYASEMAPLRGRFPELWVVDGSRLDAIAHRLKILRDIRTPILPGCVLVAYDLFRGIPRRFQFNPDAAASEMSRAHQVLDDIPRDTLVLADRLYASVALFEELSQRGLWGLFRLSARLKIRRLERLGRTRVEGGTLEDWRVEVGCGVTAPKQILRLVRLKKGSTVYEVLTNVLDPKRLSAIEAMNLYPYRWTIERMFFDLKEVLNLHRFYAANPNAVAMQVYAAALVYTAMRVAQGLIAQEQHLEPEAISPQKFFVKVARVSSMLTGAQCAIVAMKRANPGVRLKVPSLHRLTFVKTTLGAILVEKRDEHRRRRRFCEGRRRWKSFKHVPGGRAFLS